MIHCAPGLRRSEAAEGGRRARPQREGRGRGGRRIVFNGDKGHKAKPRSVLPSPSTNRSSTRIYDNTKTSARK